MIAAPCLDSEESREVVFMGAGNIGDVYTPESRRLTTERTGMIPRMAEK